MADGETFGNGTWIRSKVPVSDNGDFNERQAGAGSLATVDLIEGSGTTASYSVVFWPSFVTNFWDGAEILRDAEVLPEGHPDIPSQAEYDFASAVADIVIEGEIDGDEQTVTAPPEVVDRILAGSREGRYAGKPEIAEILGDGGEEVVLSFEEFDGLAAIAGVGDRLTPLSSPRP